MRFDKIATEQVNPHTTTIDISSTADIITMINKEDKKVAAAVAAVLPQIVQAVDVITKSFLLGGRLFYIGAGTSGRLGVLDASECPPTFGTDPSMVVGIIAGGDSALRTAIEGIEDNAEQGREDLQEHNLHSNDVVVGITASGQAPYVYGALAYAREIGSSTVAISNSNPAQIAEKADIAILPLVGPEVLMGSTRMKAGTAQKMVLNMLTTASMITIGKTYKNLMVDFTPTNRKLRNRAIRIVQSATEVSFERANQALTRADGETKVAIVMLLANSSAQQARELLHKGGGVIRKSIQQIE